MVPSELKLQQISSFLHNTVAEKLKNGARIKQSIKWTSNKAPEYANAPRPMMEK